MLSASKFTAGICRNSELRAGTPKSTLRLMELEEAVVGKRSRSWLQCRPPVQAKFRFKPPWPYRNGMACAGAVCASQN